MKRLGIKRLLRSFPLRVIPLLCLVCCSMAARAGWGVVLSQDFNSLIAGQNAIIEGWALQNCAGTNNLANQTVALRIGTKSDAGSATTPQLSVNGALTLSFTYAQGTKNSSATLTVSLIDGGSITEEASFVPSSNSAFQSATLHITDATATTRIKFSSVDGSIAIDDVVVEGDVPVPAVPSFSVAEGYYRTAQTLTMSCATTGASIRYTTNGDEPTAESALYTEPITIGEPMTIKAKAFNGDMVSEMTAARYYIGDFLYADAFTSETSGFYNLSSDYFVNNLHVGRSAILSFRVFGSTANSSLTLSVREYYGQNYSRGIVNDVVLQPIQGVWTTVTYALPLLYDNSTVSIGIFNATNACLDDVLLLSPSVITLDEHADNAETLVAYSGQIVDVETRRTLRAGIWNTLCLPFAVNLGVLNMAFGEAQDVKMMTYSSYANGIMSFSAVKGNDIIPAGVPFLLKIRNGCVNPVFRAMPITATAPAAVTFGPVTFQGVFSQTSLRTDGSDLFIGTDNYLYQPKENTNVMGGLRAYIHQTDYARICLSVGDEAAAIDFQTADAKQPTVVYTLQGQRTTAVRRGIYVVNGKKVIVNK